MDGVSRVAAFGHFGRGGGANIHFSISGQSCRHGTRGNFWLGKLGALQTASFIDIVAEMNGSIAADTRGSV